VVLQIRIGYKEYSIEKYSITKKNKNKKIRKKENLKKKNSQWNNMYKSYYLTLEIFWKINNIENKNDIAPITFLLYRNAIF